MFKRPAAVAATLCLMAVCGHAGTDGDLLAKQIETMPRGNDEKGAAALTWALTESTRRARNSKHFADRRQFQMMTHDLQEQAGKLTAPEALKYFATHLPKLEPDAQIALCFGLKDAPGHAEFDAAALKLLEPRADAKLKVALIDLLAAHKDAAVLPKIFPLLVPEQPFAIQVTVSRALAVLRDARSVPVLVKYMENFKQRGPGRCTYEATAALRAITGAKFEAEAPLWAKWWAENEKSFKVDPSAAASPSYNYELGEASDLKYYDIPVVENRLLFILDISGSMNFGGKPDRLESAKEELKKIIQLLNDRQQFNIVAFASGTARWQKKSPLVQANEQSRKDAIKFIDGLKANGGTNTSTTLEEAIDDIAVGSACESIFLVTDGNPTQWANNITPAMQARHLTWYNQPYKLRINTIGIYTTTPQEKKGIAKSEDPETMKMFLSTMAGGNDGVYKEIGK